jgi:acyl-coenzyme A thioesterase PaaI-like protein
MMNLIYKKPTLFKWGLSSWAPFMGTGISVQTVTSDFSRATIQMKQRWYNKNAFGTHFGGSLYAMCDPFFVLLLVAKLGKDYYVWDQAASIEFIKPGKGTVYAVFEWSDEQINEIILQTANGQKTCPIRSVDVVNESGELVARVSKTLYVKRRTVTA